MDQPLCTHYTGGVCGVNLLTEELGIQVEVVIGPAFSCILQAKASLLLQVKC